MNNNLKDFIQLAFDNNLNRENTSQAFNIIMSGESTDAQISAFLIALQKNGVNEDHVLGALDVMQDKMIKVNIPSIEEQKKIANFLTSLDSKIDLVSTQIENTKAFKKGLLQQMFV